MNTMACTQGVGGGSYVENAWTSPIQLNCCWSYISQGEGIESLDHISPPLIIIASNAVLVLLSGMNKGGQTFRWAVVCPVKVN